MPRFYCPEPLVAGQMYELPEAAARHASKALRLREGDALVLFDGTGGEYAASIARIERRGVVADVGERWAIERESPLSITLVQALQAGEKMDLTVQKAVELGVSRIVPVASRRSVLRLSGERAARRVEHWRAVAASACEQCGRNRLPQIEMPVELSRWLGEPSPDGALRLMLSPVGARALGQMTAPAPGRPVEILIGAEGGLDAEEAALAEAAGFRPVRLGPRVLRTETAGLAAIAAIQVVWGDFGEETKHV